MNYTVIIEQGRESGYVAYCPALKGCVSQGANKEGTMSNIKGAIEALIEDDLPVPTEVGRETVEVEISTG